MGLQLQVVNKPTCTKLPAFYFLSLVFPMSSAKDGLPTHLHHLHHHHPSIQLLHLFRTTTRTLGRPTLEAMVSTRTLTATRWRRLSSRTSASLTKRRLATPKTRRSASPLCTRTAPGSLRPTLNGSASM